MGTDIRMSNPILRHSMFCLMFQRTYNQFKKLDPEKRFQMYRSNKKIKKYEANFSKKAIAPELLEIYIEAHKLLPRYAHATCAISRLSA